MMMMTRAAGGTDLSALLGPRPTTMSSRKTWIAVLSVALVADLGAGLFLYYQKFELAAQPPKGTEVPTTTVFLERPIIEPEVKPDTPRPAAAPPIHWPDNVIETDVPPLVATPSPVTTPDTGPVFTVTEPAVTTTPGTVIAPSAPPRAPSVITNPDWIQRPTADQLLRAYPDAALERGISGSTTLNCSVRVDGTLSDCQVGNETPARQGFGRAAISLSRQFRMSPRTVDGAPVDGARVSVAIRFNVTD
ncbi:TonB family protein [uncultured Brevundimonas sp.]|uniref:TonB family protein n=1 Tax=uncultured Brevundimonas sp. TaxID=213418 RepID=UPI002610B254|nr:TonB family protein [uncultured Brevundimonas sp.]